MDGGSGSGDEVALELQLLGTSFDAAWGKNTAFAGVAY
jgi:hypothetical protein